MDLVHVSLPPVPDRIAKAVEVMAPLLNMEKGPWIGGGALHRIVTNRWGPNSSGDIDVFFKNKEQWEQLRTEFRDRLRKRHSGVQVQLVHTRFFESAEDMIDDFDFTVTQMASDGKTLLTRQETLEHIEEGKLRLNPKSTIRNVHRVPKYMAMGYLPDDELLNASLSVEGRYYTMEQPVTTPEDFAFNFVYTEKMRIMAALNPIMCRMIDGKPIAFIRGYPFHARLAYLLLTVKESFNSWKMVKEHLDAWQNLQMEGPYKLPGISYESGRLLQESAWLREKTEGITVQQFVEAYSSMTSTT